MLPACLLLSVILDIRDMKAKNRSFQSNRCGGSAPIQAAGGILERSSSSGLEIAIVHRSRYGSEWCLPKGKLDDNESWEEAAKREVKEETGCLGLIQSFAGKIEYVAKGRPKVVLFWRMCLERDCQFEASEEIDAVIWLSPTKAVQRLNHRKEAQLVAQIHCPNALYSDNQSPEK